MTLSMIVFWGGLVALVVWLVRSLAGDGRRTHEAAAVQLSDTRPTPSRESAGEILKRRYATGQIERSEYEQKSKDLG